MRDYRFGEWLATLRISNGYSQFQLGRLLGVSDKAVSKWETGAARPRTVTCEKIASLYGITLDELLSFQQSHGVGRINGEQGRSETPLWFAVRKRLQNIYGENPPVVFTSRLDAEEMLMKGTGMIEHLKLKASIWKKGIRCNDWFIQDTSLTAWLLGASFVNPLPPHTVCPHCKNTVLHPEVRDGWDLHEEICECGSPLIRDGHSISLTLTEKRFVEMDRRVYISIAPEDETAVRELIQAQYLDRWKMNEYSLAAGELTIASVFNIRLRFFFMAPASIKPPFPVVNGVYQLPSDDYIFRVADIPETLLYIIVDPVSYESSDKTPLITIPGINDLLKPNLLQKARKKLQTVPGMTVGDFGKLRLPVILKTPDKDLSQLDLNGHVVYDTDDISNILPDPLLFSTLLRCTPSSGFVRLWHEFMRNLVQTGTVSLPDFPVSQEDLFDLMKQQLLRVGIQDSGIALKAFTSMREEGPSPEVAQALLSIGCETWVPKFIEYISKNDQLKSKTYLVIAAYCFLCQLAFADDISIAKMGTDEESDNRNTSMLYEAIMQATMMKHAANAGL